MSLGAITDCLDQPARQEEAGRPAISLEDGVAWSYAELQDRSLRWAGALHELGVRPGDRVALLMFNSLDYWALYLGITRLGAIAVRVNFRLAPAELAFVLADSGASVVCFHTEFAVALGSVREEVPATRYLCFPEPEAGEEPAPELPGWAEPGPPFGAAAALAEGLVPRPGPETAAMLMYTSGTTGKPKGALWSHGNSLWIAAMQAMMWGYDADTVAMTTGPLYHVGAFEDLLLPALMVGGRAVMTRSRGFSIERAMDVCERLRVTDALLYPFMIYDLVRHPRFGEWDLGSFRRVVTGGSPIMPWAVEALTEALPQLELIPTYGLTEGGALTVAMPSGEATRRVPGAVGKPLPLTEIRIVDADGAPLGAEETGEIWVRSPSVASEYWNRPEANAETFVDGWCRTGDIGRVDREGLLSITGRAKDMIKSGGENIYPIEIEEVLTAHPAIADAAVIGVPDPRYQETVCAVVVRGEGAEIEEEDVVSHCIGQLAGYKKPRHVRFVDELPRTASGKVQKFILRERFEAGTL